tara:strand:+ start:14100 stop:14795 length:696 start_codon:yes stop_codon:yes gene_type:complete
MTSAHLVCNDCQLTLHLGTIKYAADEKRIGFSHGKYSPSELAALIEAFIAVHLEHDVETYAERAYLRLHENDAAMDLRNGRQVNDRDRTDYVAPNRIPFKKTKVSTKRKRRDGEVIRRGTSLAKVKRVYGVTNDPDPKVQGKSQYYWPERGMRIGFKNEKVISVIYFAPFPDLVGGIWVGAQAWEVDALLGTAKDEGYFSTGRVWQYDVKGFMAVGFDKQDRVRSIARWTR